MSAIDHAFAPKDIADDLETIQAKYLITHPENLETTVAAAKLYGLSESNILVFGDTSIRDSNVRCIDEALYSSNELGTPVDYTSEEIIHDPAYLYFTSGTTGKKKAVAIPQYAVMNTMHFKKWPYANVNYLAYTKFHHASSLMITMHFPLFYNSTAYIMTHFNLHSFCAAIEKHKIDVTATQPFVLSDLLNESLVKEYDISSLKGFTCGGEVLDNSITRKIKEKLGLSVLNVYGMTEFLELFESSPEITLRNGVGYLAYGFTARLVDDEGKDVPEGQMGELWVAGPTISRGYYRNPEATAKTIDADGYFHTGDLFMRDPDGLFHYINRIKDVIKYHLNHISPNEIETVLMTHPAVAECTVIGAYSSEQATELPRAYVQLVEGETKSDDLNIELQEYADNQLPDPKRLRGGVFFIDSFPRTPSGKIQRRLLRENKQQGIRVLA
jgi:4-coumarate--CoA ligase